MPKQPAFPGLRDAMKKKQTRRELFLAEMDTVVPWDPLLENGSAKVCYGSGGIVLLRAG